MFDVPDLELLEELERRLRLDGAKGVLLQQTLLVLAEALLAREKWRKLITTLDCPPNTGRGRPSKR